MDSWVSPFRLDKCLVTVAFPPTVCWRLAILICCLFLIFIINFIVFSYNFYIFANSKLINYLSVHKTNRNVISIEIIRRTVPKVLLFLQIDMIVNIIEITEMKMSNRISIGNLVTKNKANITFKISNVAAVMCNFLCVSIDFILILVFRSCQFSIAQSFFHCNPQNIQKKMIVLFFSNSKYRYDLL